MTRLERARANCFIHTGRKQGCSLEQLGRFGEARVYLSARQARASALARTCDQENGPTAIGYGGARAGGKSHWLLAQIAVDDCQRFPGLKCLLVRKTARANLEQFDALRKRILRRLKYEMRYQRARLTFANGSEIVLGHFQHENDIDDYLGQEYDLIGIKEATTLTESKHNDLLTVCRTSKPGWRPRIYSTTNPGGVGHAWYKKKFILPFLSGNETDTRFVPARVSDNIATNKEYIRTLEGLHGWQRRAWLDGDWDIESGNFFTNFSPAHHVTNELPQNPVKWWAAMDYGFTHYTVVLLACADKFGNITVAAEHAACKLLPIQHAELINKMFAQYVPKDYPITIYAGHDVFSTESTGSTVADEYRKHGIKLTPANTDRVPGWAEINTLLGHPAAGIPAKLKIHTRCTKLIACLPLLQHSPTNPEDVAKLDLTDTTDLSDDPADALRYLISSTRPPLTTKRLIG